jgi:hypothetical protein
MQVHQYAVIMVTLVFRFLTNVMLLHQPIPDGSCSLDKLGKLELPTTEVKVLKGYQWKRRRCWHTSRCFVDDAEKHSECRIFPVQISFRKAEQLTLNSAKAFKS